MDKRAAHLFSLDSNPEIILWLLQDLKQIKFERAERAALNGWLCRESAFCSRKWLNLETAPPLPWGLGWLLVHDRDSTIVVGAFALLSLVSGFFPDFDNVRGRF